MENTEFDYYMENLKACDPDYIVDVLGITAEELLASFFVKACDFINKEHG